MPATIRVIGHIAVFKATPKTVTSPVSTGKSAIFKANTPSKAPTAVVTATRVAARALRALVRVGCSCKNTPISSTAPANADDTLSTAGVTTDEKAVLTLLEALCHFSSRVDAVSAVWLSTPSEFPTAFIQFSISNLPLRIAKANSAPARLPNVSIAREVASLSFAIFPICSMTSFIATEASAPLSEKFLTAVRKPIIMEEEFRPSYSNMESRAILSSKP